MTFFLIFFLFFLTFVGRLLPSHSEAVIQHFELRDFQGDNFLFNWLRTPAVAVIAKGFVTLSSCGVRTTTGKTLYESGSGIKHGQAANHLAGVQAGGGGGEGGGRGGGGEGGG